MDGLSSRVLPILFNLESMPPRQTPISLSEYEKFLGELKRRIRSAQVRAGLSVNRELVLLYWGIGRDILERQKMQGWGARIIDSLARDLGRDFPDISGFSARNLKYMRAFAEAWPDEQIVQATLAQLPWYHHIALIEKLKDLEERLWYARQSVQSGWSRNVLVHQIESQLHRRQGHALTNFDRTLPAPQSELAQQILKDPYNFDFLSLGPEMLERDLERGLIEHIRDFFLELGKGFALVGSQYRFEIGGRDYSLDLLFYHLRLRCYVVVDLKIEDFKPEFAGKMNFYLSAIDDLLRHSDDAASIGIIICKDRNAVTVKYALKDASKPIGVAQYQLKQALPEKLKQELPTIGELARNVLLVSLVMLRATIEHDLAALFLREGLDRKEQVEMAHNSSYLATILHKHKHISTELLQKIEFVSEGLNRTAHGERLSYEAAGQLLALGNEILRKLAAPQGGRE